MQGISKFHVFSFKLEEETLIYILHTKWFKQCKHIYNFHFFSMLCKSVGLSSCWTIEPWDSWYPPYKSMVMIWTYWWYKIMYMHFLSHMLPSEAGTSRSDLNVYKHQIGLACWIFYSFANTCNSLEYNKKDNCLQNQWQQEHKNWKISALCMVVLILREITWKVLMVDTFSGDV